MAWKTNKLIDLKKQYLIELSAFYDTHEADAMINLLIYHFFRLTRTQLALSPEYRLTESEMLSLHFAVKELKEHKPVQYVIGEVEFLNTVVQVNEHVLIPRPETEELVAYILKNETTQNMRVLDIGTGSGCIAIALKKNLADADVYATDISNNALRVADQNARNNNTHIHFLCGDINQTTMAENPEQFDIIVSNPPYVTESEKNLMKENVVAYEPHNALFVPDDDPLMFYRSILRLCEHKLKKGGRIYLEINEKYGEALKEFLELNNFQEVTIHKDINNKDRYISALR